jgi:hypothetical protein
MLTLSCAGRVRRLTLLPPPPLRTVLATFTAHGSITDKPRFTGAGRVCDKHDLHVTQSRRCSSLARCRAAPVVIATPIQRNILFTLRASFA